MARIGFVPPPVWWTRRKVFRSSCYVRGLTTFLVVWLTVALLTACQALDRFPLTFLTPAATPTTDGAVLTLTPQPTPEPTQTPTPLPPNELTLWLPPEFAPGSGGRAGEVLDKRLAAFEAEYGIRIKVRLKAASGPGGLLESLSAASVAAPRSLPGVVALPRPEFEVAAIKGLLVPLDPLGKVLESSDWYPYARELAMVQGVAFGLPFAGDAQVLVYRASQVRQPFNTWEDLIQLGQPVGVAFSSPTAMTTLALYRSIGGEVEDAQHRPLLQSEPLARVLTLYRTGANRGLFPLWMAEFQSESQVWQAYQDQRFHACVAWISDYLGEQPPDSLPAPLPQLENTPYTLATGWVWAVADPLPERQALSIALVEWLSDSQFLGEWSEAAGFLPTRPAALSAWQNQTFKSVLAQVALSAHARPSTELLSGLGGVLEEAAVRVVRLEAEPSQAAVDAVERLANRQTR